MKVIPGPLIKSFCAIFVILLVGCETKLKPAIHLDPGFQQAGIHSIDLMPPLDSRIDTTEDVDIEDLLRENVADQLESKGYVVIKNGAALDRSKFNEINLKSGDPGWIKGLPSHERWVMIVSLVDVESKLTFGSTGNAEVTGYLYDRNDGKIVWRDKGVGKVGQGGLIGMLFKGLMANDAIRFAVRNMTASIPKREGD